MSTENRENVCPYCKEEIKEDAIKCKHCHSNLTPTKPSHEGICPYCKEEIKEDAIKCKHCHSNLIQSMKSGCEDEYTFNRIPYDVGEMPTFGRSASSASSSLSRGFFKPSFGGWQRIEGTIGNCLWGCKNGVMWCWCYGDLTWHKCGSCIPDNSSIMGRMLI